MIKFAQNKKQPRRQMVHYPEGERFAMVSVLQHLSCMGTTGQELIQHRKSKHRTKHEIAEVNPVGEFDRILLQD